jgi:hypothetical protein
MNPSDPYSQDSSSSTNVAANRLGDNESGGTAAKAKRAAGRAVDQAKEKVSQAADTGKEAAAGKIGGYSDRLRETARSAEQEDPNIAHFANSAADRLQEVADYVRTADLSRIRQDADNIARRNPALFMGGMFAAGLVLGNLAKASVQTLREDTGDEDGPDGRYSEDNEEAAGEVLGGVSDSFDAEPRENGQSYTS